MLTYFLQVNVCWLLFYGAYYALLSKETFFMLNRIYLIASLLCGLALPFVADYFAIKVEPVNLVALTLEPFVVTAKSLQSVIAQNKATEGVVLKALMYVYTMGAGVLAIRFLAGLFLIFKLFFKSKKEQKDGFALVATEGSVPPFSFFNFIFINPNNFENIDFQQIMQHEQAHVRQRHSFDVVFLEFLNIAFWCSPLIYFYKKSLRNVHEYLADEAVLRYNATPKSRNNRDVAKAQYGRLLLRQQPSGGALSLTSNISNHFFSQLKKRILMMTRHKSKRIALIKYAFAAPIFLILTAALASPKMPILAKTEVLGEKVIKTIDNQEVPFLDSRNLPQKETPQYSTTRVDTTFKPLSDIKLVDEKQIAQMNIESKEEFNTRITITFKDGHIEYFKGAKSDMEKVFKKETLDAAKLAAEKEAMKQKLDDEQKAMSQRTQKLEDEQKNMSQQGQKLEDEQKASNQYAQKLEAEKQAVIEQKMKMEAEKSGADPVFTVVEEQPEFPQGMQALFKWLGQNIKYPAIAQRAKAEGTVYIGFVVEKDGTITNVKIKRDAPVIIRDTITIIETNGIKGNKIVEKTDYSLGKEAVRVIQMMPNWKPAKQGGKVVRVAYTLPIKFKLE